jgi:hypothetical protein
VPTKAEGEKGNRRRLRSQLGKDIDMEMKRTRAMTWQEERKEAQTLGLQLLRSGKAESEKC